MKHGLRPAIIAGLMPTLATGLAGMPGVDLDHADTACLGFVLDKAVQLGKAPTMQAAFCVALGTRLLATPQPGGVPDVPEVFKHDGCTWWRILNDALREDVIVLSMRKVSHIIPYCQRAWFPLGQAPRKERRLPSQP